MPNIGGHESEAEQDAGVGIMGGLRLMPGGDSESEEQEAEPPKEESANDPGIMLVPLITTDEDDKEDEVALRVFIQQQHKIIKRYTINGDIPYQEAPYFHELVETQNHLIISIFEVFALNRNPDDFLENLQLIRDYINVGSESNHTEPVQDPYEGAFQQIKDNFTQEEISMLAPLVAEQNKIAKNALDVFMVNKNINDCVGTFRILIKRLRKNQ